MDRCSLVWLHLKSFDGNKYFQVIGKSASLSITQEYPRTLVANGFSFSSLEVQSLLSYVPRLGGCVVAWIAALSHPAAVISPLIGTSAFK